VSVTLALAGDTMLGRGVGDVIADDPTAPLLAPGVAELTRGADACICNLECCISERGSRFNDPRKPFFFRAPPAAAEVLAGIGVDCVTLANNHALDFGATALLDTIDHLHAAGIVSVGAGPDETTAREPRVLRAGGLRVRVVAATDHPAAYAAAPEGPGVAYADLRYGVPDWLRAAARPGPDADAVLVSPHWGPNMATEPVAHVRAAGAELVAEGATLVAGHSAHVFHGMEARLLYDLGDFIDDYRVDARRRNDLGLLFLVSPGTSGIERVEAVPLRLRYAWTELADGDDAAWIRARFTDACARLGTTVREEGGRLVVV
jgi:poly-gamma-glutamate capsule biosynthesis protein CapA/YwtB (metallophosphatase superfamily)